MGYEEYPMQIVFNIVNMFGKDRFVGKCNKCSTFISVDKEIFNSDQSFICYTCKKTYKCTQSEINKDTIVMEIVHGKRNKPN